MNDAPCTPEDRAAIVACARYRREYLLHLANRLDSKWPHPITLSDEAARILRWVAEGTVCNPIGETTNIQPDSKGR